MYLSQKNNEIVSTPLQDGQGRWYEMLSPTQVLTGQEPLVQQQQQQDQELRKKKSRGNRADQHFRKRLRARNVDEATIKMLMDERMKQKIHNMDQDNV
jgi:hypothetical protein